MSTPAIMRHRRDTAANWTSTNPVLEDGQLGFETDTKLSKLGDGTTAWNSLGYTTSSASIPNGDKGDITVSGGGSTWTIDNDAVTYAKIQNVTATDKLLGRVTAGAGDIEEITCTAAGRALLDDADAAAQRTTLGLGTAATANTTAFETAGAVATHAAVTSGVHGISAFGATLVDDADAATARTTLGLGTAATANTTAFEAAGAVSTHAAVTSGVHGISAFGATLVDDADAATARTTLGLGTLATQSGTFSGTSSGTNTGDQNLFSTIAVSGQSNVVADATSDTLTFVAGTGMSLTTNATTDTVTFTCTVGGISDGDKGDITVSASGATWTIDNSAVTYAKIQNVSATDKLLGRSTAGAGVVEEITCTAAGRALLDDADAAAQRTTLGLGTAATQASTAFESAGAVSTHAAVTSGVHGISAFGATLVDDADAAAARTTLGLGTLATQSGTFSGTSSGTNTGDQNLFSTIAVSGQSNVVADSTSDTLTLVAGSNITITTNATTDEITITSTAAGVTDGDKGDITVSASGATWTIDNDAVTYAKIQNVSATDRILGRVTAGAGDIEEITCTAAGRALLDDADAAAQRTTLGLGTIATAASGDYLPITGGTVTGATIFHTGGATSTTTFRSDSGFNIALNFDEATSRRGQLAYNDSTGGMSFSVSDPSGVSGTAHLAWAALWNDYTRLYYAGTAKFSTLTDGIEVYGTAYMDGLMVAATPITAHTVANQQNGTTYITPVSQVSGANNTASLSTIFNWTAAVTAGPALGFASSKSGTIGTFTASVDGDVLGYIIGYGTDGTNFLRSADITFLADGTISSGIAPGEIRFRTANSSGTLTERLRIDSAGLATLTGDLTVSGTITGALAAGSVSYAEMQDVSATQRVLGRNTAGSGDVEEVTLSQLLDWANGTPLRGVMLYRGASGWSVLGTGTAGYLLQTNGTNADPTWVAPPTGGTAGFVSTAKWGTD